MLSLFVAFLKELDRHDCSIFVELCDFAGHVAMLKRSYGADVALHVVVRPLAVSQTLVIVRLLLQLTRLEVLKLMALPLSLLIVLDLFRLLSSIFEVGNLLAMHLAVKIVFGPFELLILVILLPYPIFAVILVLTVEVRAIEVYFSSEPVLKTILEHEF